MNYAKLVPTLFVFFCINYNSLCFHRTHLKFHFPLCLNCFIFFLKILLVKKKLYISILQVVLILQFMVQSTYDLGTNEGLITLDFSQRDARGLWCPGTCIFADVQKPALQILKSQVQNMRFQEGAMTSVIIFQVIFI